MLKKLILVFVLAFTLNWAWEISQSVLYLYYNGGPLTAFILFRAAIADAVMILILIVIAQKITINKSLFIVLTGLVLAIAIEIWALQVSHWEYNALMPIIPIINVGLTPTIQLVITGYIVQKIVRLAHHK
jgi:hypothetical protein